MKRRMASSSPRQLRGMQAANLGPRPLSPSLTCRQDEADKETNRSYLNKAGPNFQQLHSGASQSPSSSADAAAWIFEAAKPPRANCSLAVATRSRSRDRAAFFALRRVTSGRVQNRRRQRRRLCSSIAWGIFIATARTPSMLLTHRMPTRTAVASLAVGQRDLALSDKSRVEASLFDDSVFALQVHVRDASMLSVNSTEITSACSAPWQHDTDKREISGAGQHAMYFLCRLSPDDQILQFRQNLPQHQQVF